ncbi:MAG: prolyl oligopeptidase family serine peptidase, partial [Planctomycetota bacterium]|nr:prolyl oligopeptidase family serine peptidase [Planctomycetota bacterium]
GRGDVPVHIPSSYDPAVPAGLLLVLHSYILDGAGMEAYFNLAPLTEEHGFIYTYPDGSIDSLGFRFWNATSACCDMDNSGIDDVGYLLGLLDLVASQYNVDPLRVHIAGHSNGGFMAYRLICEDSERFASIVSFAGATHNDPADCNATSPCHVLQIHGTLDPIVNYYGGFINDTYPSATQTCTQWAAHNGCLPNPVSGSNINIDGGIPFSETTVQRWEAGCDDGGSAELWSILLGGHLPVPSGQMADLIFQYILEHPKPTPIAVDQFIRGDSNADQSIDLSDAIETLNYLFGNGAIGCRESANCNSDLSVDLSDVVYLLGFMFANGPPPGSPFPDCGPQPLSLDCVSPTCP